MVTNVLKRVKQLFEKDELKKVPEAAFFKNYVNTITLFGGMQLFT